MWSPARGQAAPLPSSLLAGTMAVPTTGSSVTTRLGRARFGRNPKQGDPQCMVEGPMSLQGGGSAMPLPPAPVPDPSRVPLHSVFIYFPWVEKYAKCCFFKIILKMVLLPKAGSHRSRVLGAELLQPSPTPDVLHWLCHRPDAQDSQEPGFGYPGGAGSFETQTCPSDPGCTWLMPELFKITNEHCNH